jgi:hypothetical protein
MGKEKPQGAPCGFFDDSSSILAFRFLPSPKIPSDLL